MLGYENIVVKETDANQAIIILRDTSYMREIANLLKQVQIDFGATSICDAQGRYIMGKGFIVGTFDDAQRVAKKIVEEVYSKKGTKEEEDLEERE